MAVIRKQVELTRPADTDAYSIGDGVSSATSGPAAIKVDGISSGYIVGMMMHTDEPDLTPRFKIHLFRSAPTQIADNAACTAPLYADADDYLGAVDLQSLSDQDVTGDDSSYAQDMELRHPIDAKASLFMIWQTLDAFTPTSGQKFTLTVLVEG